MIDYSALFDALPDSSFLLKADAPRYTILAATPQHLKHGGVRKKDILGKSLFEAYPANPDNPADTGEINMRESLDFVLRFKKPHRLPVQRYDVADEQGQFIERYWRAENKPVFSVDGEVSFILQTTEELTAQIKAEERETQTENIKKAFALFMHAPMVVGLVNGDDYVLELANEEALKFWGKGPEIIGKALALVFPELEGQGTFELFDNVRSSGQPYFAHEVPVSSFVNGKEEQHYFNLVYQPYYGTISTAATGVFTISYNVTEQVKARQKSEEKYHTLFESIDQGFCIVEMIFNEANEPVDYRFLEVNPVFEKQTGLENAAGKTMRELAPSHEEHWFAQYGRVAVTGEAIRFRERAAALGRWFDVYAFRIGSGEGHNVALLFSDITDQKQAEEAIIRSEQNLRNMILQSPAAMCIFRGPTFIVEVANDKMYELWGRSKDTLLEKSIFDGLPEARSQGYEESLTSVFTTGKSFSATDIPVNLPRGEKIETVYINLLFEALKEGDGSISGVMAVAIDVTEQVLAKHKIEDVVEERTRELAQANDALHRTNKELHRSNQNLEEFAHAASHDLKEPVRKIHYFINQLRRQFITPLDEGQARSFNRIENATERMGNLIDDLLLYSHVSQRPHEKESVDLNEKMQRVLEDLELDIQEKGAVITTSKLPVIKGYRRQLQQLVQNLISNALKYSKAGVAPRIDITAAEVTEKDKIYHLISVRDNGIGFEQKHANIIFQIFTRLHGRAEFSGSGIGLSIVKKVTENHGGFVQVESSPGEGSTFMIFLPVE